MNHITPQRIIEITRYLLFGSVTSRTIEMKISHKNFAIALFFLFIILFFYQWLNYRFIKTIPILIWFSFICIEFIAIRFIQNKTTINNLDINYGVRFDKYEFETGLGEVSDSTISPNFGLDYKINENSNVYANYGQSSRMSGTIPFTWMMNIRGRFSKN